MEILDLIAKVSWETNTKALEGINSELRKEDKLLEELRNKGRALNDQLMKTSDPKKMKSLNDELQKTRKAVDSITESQKKQVTVLNQLGTKQQDIINKLRQTSDPKLVQGLLRNLQQVGNQMDALSKKASDLPSKMGGIGSSLLQGIGLGAGMFGLQQAGAAISAFVGDSIAEFEDATKTALDLERALKSIGKTKYFDGLKGEADTLAVKFHGLFDNDDIIKAQTALVQYGKVSREEMSKLLPVIMNLASAEGIDLLQATEKVVNIMEGRGGQTLRDYGLSVKGVKTEHDRLNLVLGEFQTKLEGASDTYAKTAAGMQKINEIQLKNIEENFGESFSKIKMRVLPVITEILTEVNELMANFDDSNGWVDNLKSFGAIFSPSLASAMKTDRLLRQAQENRIKNTAGVGGFVALSDKGGSLNPNATTENPEAEAANRKAVEDAKKRLEDAKRLEQQMLEGRKKLDSELLSLQNEYLAAQTGKDEIELNNVREKYRKLYEEAKKYKYDITGLQEQEQKDLNVLTQKFAKRDLDVLNTKNEESLVAKKKAQQEEFDLIVESTNRQIEATKSQIQQEAEKTKAAKKESEERKKIAREELFNSLQNLAGEVSNLLSIETQRIDGQIALQEKRVEAAKKSSDKSLAIEQNRLDELTRKRERYERTQRTIDAAVIVANQAVAISGAIRTIASGGNPVLIAANVVAIIAGIAASIGAIRSVNAGSGFKDGGYTGDGDPSEVSTNLGNRGYKYHKKEFVMNEGITSKHRDMLEGMHNGHLIVNKMNDGYYLSSRTIDTDRAISDYHSVKNSVDMGGVQSMLMSIDKRLSQREVKVENNFDVNGFGMQIATQLGQVHLKNSLRK